MMLHTKYQGSRPCGFFFMFSLYNVTPEALVRGPRDVAKYQISRLYALWFQTRRFCKVFIAKNNLSMCDLDMQQT